MEDLNNINLFDEQNESENLPGPGNNFPVSLSRSRTNVIISGTCSGIAEYFNADPVIIRIVFILGMLFGMWAALIYIVAAFLLPPENNPKELSPDEIQIQQKVNFRTVLSGLLLFLGFFLAFRYFGFMGGFHLFFFTESISISIVAVAAGIFFIFKNPPGSLTLASNKEKFLRSKTDSRIFGVCGGLAKYINFDSSSLRILFLLIFFLTVGLSGVFYLAAAVMVPKDMDEPNG